MGGTTSTHGKVASNFYIDRTPINDTDTRAYHVTLDAALKNYGYDIAYRDSEYEYSCSGLKFKSGDQFLMNGEWYVAENQNFYFNPTNDLTGAVLDNVTAGGTTVEKSGGGMAGVRDEGGIRSTLDFVQDDLYYPEIADKAAYLMFSLCRGHYFADCNKRISITLTLYFLVKNGYMYLAKTFMEEMEAIGYHVAAGHIDRDLLTEVMRCIVNDEDYSESIKLELIEAMSKDIGFTE